MSTAVLGHPEPEAWPWFHLDQVAARGTGHTPSRRRPEYWDGPIGWVSLADTGRLDQGAITATERTITQAGVANSSAVVHPADTVVLLRGSSVGKSAVLGTAMAVSQDYVTWSCGPDLDPWFLYYVLQARKREFERVGFGNTIKTIGLDYFKHLALPIPSVAEQRRVAAAMCDADGLISALERAIAKKQTIKQGMMQQLLTGRTRLPGFDESWTDVRLGNHVSYVKTVALSRAQLDGTSPLRYLHYGDIHTRTNATLNAAVEVMPRAPVALAGRAGRLQPGDLVFADASEDPAGVGKSVEIVDVPVEGVVPGLHTIAARFDKSVLADGFKAHVQFIPTFRQALLRLVAGTKVLATTRSFISGITISLPPVDEQRTIAGVLADVESELAALHARLDKARDIKTGMMQQLLTGRVRLPVGDAS